MDCDLKVPSWDLAELEREVKPITGSTVTASTNTVELCKKGSDCSIDLQLGTLGNLESSDRWEEQLWVPTPLVSPSGLLKRTRAKSNGSRVVSCLVDGCRSDLSKCKEYHCRHKVCEAHSKTPIVLIGGREQRFCQQCSRFHLLVEFDEMKRSCRKRLAGHNRRRRKPQPQLINTRNMFLNLQVPNFSSYPRAFTTGMPDTNWRHNQPFCLLDRPQHISGPYFSNHKNGKQFPFLQDDNSAISIATSMEPSIYMPLHITSSSSESSNRNISSDRLTQVLNSDCALSLLSLPIHAPQVSHHNMLYSDEIPAAVSSVQNLHKHGNLDGYSHSLSQASNNVSLSPTQFPFSRLDDEKASAVLVPDASDVDLRGCGIFSSQTFFSWQ